MPSARWDSIGAPPCRAVYDLRPDPGTVVFVDTQDAIDYMTAPAAVVDARAAELFGRLATLERDPQRQRDALAMQRALAARAARERPKIAARQPLTVDLRDAGSITTTDAQGTRTSAAPDILGWRYAAAILRALAATGPHTRSLALRATDLGIGATNPGTALRNHRDRVAERLERDGHGGLASLLLALTIHRDGRVTIEQRGGPLLELHR